MSSFQRQLSRPPPNKSGTGLSRPLALASTLVPATSPVPRSHQVLVSIVRPSEIDLADPPAIDPESVMAATRGAAREALAEKVELLRRMEIMASQPSVLEGYTLDLELSEVVKQLPGYL